MGKVLFYDDFDELFIRALRITKKIDLKTPVFKIDKRSSLRDVKKDTIQNNNIWNDNENWDDNEAWDD